MRRLGLSLIVACLAVAIVAGQATKVISSGTLPAHCSDGAVYVKTGSSAGWYVCQSGSWTGPYPTTSGTGASTADHFVTTQSETDLSNESSLGSLTTGLLLNTVSAGVGTPSTFGGSTCSGSQYATAIAADGALTCGTPTGAGNVTTSATLTSGKVLIGNGSADVTVASTTGIAKVSSGTLSAASDGTDYLSPATGMTRLAQIVTASSQATVDFTSISGAYSALKIVALSRDTQSGTSDVAVYLKVNNDGTSGNYTATSRIGSANANTFSTTIAATGNGAEVAFHPQDGNTAGYVASLDIMITGYAGTTWKKVILGLSGLQQDTLNGVVENKMFVWKSTSAITRLTFTAGGTAFKDGSVFTLYGMP